MRKLKGILCVALVLQKIRHTLLLWTFHKPRTQGTIGCYLLFGNSFKVLTMNWRRVLLSTLSMFFSATYRKHP